jgi:hypothetical protein
MYKLNLNENCARLKTKLIQQYTNVTEDDLNCSNGRKEEMIENLKTKLGKTASELNEIILKL